MACAGIDFGSRRSVVAIARRGGVDICCNEVSNRATPSLVSFSGDQRHIGEAAANFAAQNARNTVSSIQRLLGACFDAPFTKREVERLTAQVVPTKNKGVAACVSYGSPNDEGDVPVLELPFEALAGMLFSSLLDIATAEYKSPVRDCVITVPGYYNENQRRAVLAAATIGNVNVLRVMNEHAAIALSYGIVRTSQLPEDKPVKVAFVDMGDASTTVSIAAFTNARAEIVSVAFDPELGGRDFDAAIAGALSEQFTKKYNINVMSKQKPKIRLLKEAEKVKRVLSANSKAVLNIECLMNDVDVSGQMDRDEFESLIAPLIDRLKSCCARAIGDANLKEEEKLISVEIVGASTRVPAVKSAIQSCFEPLGAQLMTTLNMDECVARGAALMSAMLSPAFKVRDYNISDIAPYAIDAEKVFSSGSSEIVPLVPRYNHTPCVKAMTFKAPGPLTININYHDAASLTQGYAAKSIGSYKIDAPEDSDAKIRAKVRVTADGTMEFAGAQMTKEVEVWEEVPQKAPVNNKMDETETVPLDSQDVPLNPTSNGDLPDHNPNKAPEAMDTEPQTANSATPVDNGTQTGEVKPSEPAVPEKRLVKKAEHTDLAIVRVEIDSAQLSLPDVQAAVEREASMKATDRYIKERSDAMNSLEGFVYDLRSRFDECGDLKDYGPESMRDPLRKELDDIEEWIYSEEGEKASKSAFTERKNVLYSTVEPIIKRKREREERPAAISALEATMESYKKLAVPTCEEYAHIEQSEKDKVMKCIENATLWLKAEVTKQNALPLHVDPVLTCSSLKDKRVEIDKFCRPIERTPKPAPVVVEEPGNSNEKTAAESEKPTAESEHKNGTSNVDSKEPLQSDKKADGPEKEEQTTTEADMEVD